MWRGQCQDESRDAFVRKYDAAGNELWTRQFGAHARRVHGVAADASGVYVAGTHRQALCRARPPGISVDAFVRRYDAGGNELWTRQFGTAGVDDAFGVAVDASGVYVAGVTSGTLPGQTSTGGGDAFVRKYDAAGTEVWTRQFGTAGTR